MRILGYVLLTLGMLNMGTAVLPPINPDFELWRSYRMMVIGVILVVGGYALIRELRRS